MSIGIGIDTGGTYTDIVLYDSETEKILAKGKSPTTKGALNIGISNAFKMLPKDMLEKAEVLALSTTLATNACVENKGGLGKMIFLGVNEGHLNFINTKTTYNLDRDQILCLPRKAQSEEPFETIVTSEALATFLKGVHSVAVTEYQSQETNASSEKELGKLLAEEFHIPVVGAHEVANELNVFERGSTAFLNARLLPVLEEFIIAIEKVLTDHKLKIHTLIVRSDGSLMVEEYAAKHPVKTILSGPAASVMGGQYLANKENCIIIDMGGTTTDISIVKNGDPVMVKGIKIGGYQTQVPGVLMDTFSLGGDSRIYAEEGNLKFGTGRVEPLCVAGSKYPEVKKFLEELVASERKSFFPRHEFLTLVKMPKNLELYSESEKILLERLGKGILSLNDHLDPCSDIYKFSSERLEKEGLVLRCGLTPTDIMHLKGDFSGYDVECARLGAEFVASQMYDVDEPILCDKIYNMVSKKMYENVIRILLTYENEKLFHAGVDEQVAYFTTKAWNDNEEGNTHLLQTQFITDFTLIGVGAPTGIFLPKVAKKLHTDYLIPEHAEVANAIGAIISDISAEVQLEIKYVNDEETKSFIVKGQDSNVSFETLEEAVAYGEKIGKEMAIKECKARGALGELQTVCNVNHRAANLESGICISLGSEILVKSSGRIS